VSPPVDPEPDPPSVEPFVPPVDPDPPFEPVAPLDPAPPSRGVGEGEGVTTGSREGEGVTTGSGDGLGVVTGLGDGLGVMTGLGDGEGVTTGLGEGEGCCAGAGPISNTCRCGTQAASAHRCGKLSQAGRTSGWLIVRWRQKNSGHCGFGVCRGSGDNLISAPPLTKHQSHNDRCFFVLWKVHGCNGVCRLDTWARVCRLEQDAVSTSGECATGSEVAPCVTDGLFVAQQTLT
jgi:hypothetical protein